MNKLLLVLGFLGGAMISFGQHTAHQLKSNVVPQMSHSYSIEGQLGSSEEISAYFIRHHDILANSEYKLVNPVVTKSLTGTHYTYSVTKNGCIILDVQLKVHIGLKGEVLLVQDNIPEIDQSVVLGHSLQAKRVWVETQDGWLLPELKLDKDGGKSLWVADSEIHSFETKLYYQAPDSQVSAQVFLVNPLNTAEKSYGSPYIDSSDQDVNVINAERKWVTMNAHYENDTFWLKNNRYYFDNISDPKTPQTYSTNDTFSFTRSRYQFEDVNAFYHITAMSDYVEQLGFETALPDTLVIDAHAYNGADFSSFNYGVSPVELEFGEGGVDDAEDGEIVVHEFAHSLSHTAGGDSYSSTRDRAAMEEGNADYFSASYSKAYTDFAWQLMFNWDGHNPFFQGIHIGDKLTYPSDMKNNTNHDRELWSTPLMCIYDKIGRGAADSLVLEHLYYQFKSSSIPEMANILLKIDSMVWDGKYHHDIRNCFAEHDILASTGQSIEFSQLFTAFNTLGFSQGVSVASITAKDGQDFNYVVYNNLGEMVDQGMNTYRLEIDPSNFVSGIYFVELKMDNVSSYLKLLKH